MTHEMDADVAMDQRLLHRMVFFTDAVFAIVLTLLVLELRPPEGLTGPTRAQAMQEMVYHLVSFAMSFALVATFWLAHLSVTRRMIHFDWPTAVANLVFLFPICLIPFVSAWLGGGFGDDFTWAMYCWALVGTSVGNIALVLVSTRGNGRLLDGFTPRERAFRLVRASSPGVAFGAGLILGQMGQQVASQFCFVLIPVVMLLAGLLFGPKKAVAAAAPTA